MKIKALISCASNCTADLHLCFRIGKIRFSHVMAHLFFFVFFFVLRFNVPANNFSVMLGLSQHLSRIMRKPDFCLGENKGADQLRGNREADQRLCFRYSDSTIPLLLKSEISSFLLFSELVQAGLCRTWSETPKTGFLASRLISC